MLKAQKYIYFCCCYFNQKASLNRHQYLSLKECIIYTIYKVWGLILAVDSAWSGLKKMMVVYSVLAHIYWTTIESSHFSFPPNTCMHIYEIYIPAHANMCKAPPRPDTHNCTSNSVVASKSRRVFVAWSSLDFRLYPVMPPTLQALCNSESRNKILAREKEALALKH